MIFVLSPFVGLLKRFYANGPHVIVRDLNTFGYRRSVFITIVSTSRPTESYISKR